MEENIGSPDQGKPTENSSNTKVIEDQSKAPENAITMPMHGSGDIAVSVSQDIISTKSTSEPVTTCHGDHKDNPELSTIGQIQENPTDIPKYLKDDNALNSEDFVLKWDEDFIDEKTPSLIENLQLGEKHDNAVKPVGVDAIDDDSKPIDKKITDTEISEEVAEKADVDYDLFCDKMNVDSSDVVELGADSVAPSSTENTDSTVMETQKSMKEEIEIPPFIEVNLKIEESTDAKEASEIKVVSYDVENVLIEDKTSDSPIESETSIPDFELKWDEDDEDVIDEETPGLIENLQLGEKHDNAVKPVGVDEMDVDAIEEKNYQLGENHDNAVKPVGVDEMDVDATEEKKYDGSKPLDKQITDTEISEEVAAKADAIDEKIDDNSIPLDEKITDTEISEEVAEKSDAIDEKIDDDSKPLDKKITDTEISEEVAEKADVGYDFCCDKINVDASDVVDELGADSVAPISTENTDSTVMETQKSIKEEIEISSFIEVNLKIEETTDITEASEIKVVSNDVENVSIEEKTSKSPIELQTLIPEEVPKVMVSQTVNIIEIPIQATIDLPAASISKDDATTVSSPFAGTPKETISKFTEDSDVTDLANTEIALKELTTDISNKINATDQDTVELPVLGDIKESILDYHENTVTKDNTTEDKQVESIEDFISTRPVLKDSKIEELLAEDNTNKPREDDKIPVLSPTETDLNQEQEASLKTEVLSTEISLSNNGTEENNDFFVKDKLISTEETSDTFDETGSMPVIEEVKTEVMETQAEEMANDDDDFVTMTDSLGLLSESTRMIEEEDDQDDDDDGDGDDEEDADDDHDEQDDGDDGKWCYLEQKTPEKQIMSTEDAVSPDVKDEPVTAIEKLVDIDKEIEKEMESMEKHLKEKIERSILKNFLSTSSLETAPEATTKVQSDGENKEDAEKSGQIAPKTFQTSKQRGEVENIVELEESSEDDLQEVQRLSPPPSPAHTEDDKQLTSVNIPAAIDIMSAGSRTSSIVSGQGEVVVQGLPRPHAAKKTRLNTSEVSIKTANTAAEPLVIPETKFENLSKARKDTPHEKCSLEIFSLDSDEEDSNDATDIKVNEPSAPVRRLSKRCVNPLCRNDNAVVKRFPADGMVQRYYEVKRRRVLVCEHCADHVSARAWQLMEDFKSSRPLLSLSISRPGAELVEVLDSDSDGEGEGAGGGEELRAGGKSPLGAERILELEEQLADMINKTWGDCNLSERLMDAKIDLEGQLDYLEKGRQQVAAIFDDLQAANDLLRLELYDSFAPATKHLPALEIYDTPDRQYTGVVEETEYQEQEIRRSKRPRPVSVDNSTSQAPAAKRAAIPLGFKDNVESKDDDSTDIRVVKLSAESAPSSLPPAGSLTKPPLKAGDIVLAMRETSGTWLRATVLEVLGKLGTGSNQFTNCRIRFEHKSKLVTTLTARQLAYWEPANVRLIIGTRVIALFLDTANMNKRRMYYSGIIAEMPNPVNNYRYLIFFDIGYAQYVTHGDARVVCESAWLVWEEVQPLSREFVRQYLVNYPERPMVRLHAGQSLKTEWNGKWWVSKVLQVDASLVQVYFEADDRTEWIYRGSTRLAPLYLELQAAERARPRHSTANKRNLQNMPYVEYTRSDEAADVAQKTEEQIKLHNEELRRQRAVAKKSTATPLPPHSVSYPQPLDSVMSRVVYYTPKAAVKPYKMTTHACSPRCRRTDVLPLKELRTYNPLARPLLSGWERQLVRYKGRKEVMYRAPCGRRLRNMPELHRYLTATQSEMCVDLFDFNPMTHCLAEFLLNRCRVTKKDLSHGKENVPVPCVNYYDNSLPEMCLYNTERSPTAGVPLNLDDEFLCGCDCTDDCEDKSKCQCWQLTLEGARTIGMDEDDVGYVYRRLPEPVHTGIYECNSRCKCKHTCLNRVAQHPLQLKLQVFKTQNRGWGIRALNDVPKGAFLCVYAGNLLTDATANLDGLNEGDEYLAELDYIEVVEQMKEGFEEDVPEKDKKLDKKEGSSDTEEEESSSSEEDERPGKSDEADDDFKPDYIPHATPFKKSLRKRDKKKKGEVTEEQAADDNPSSKREGEDDGCITISDDEDVKEPSHFTAQAGMAADDLSPKKKSVRSHFGKDEACYIMDAKVQGNIGRYLNHSCMPNVFVQNVFVDTHDLRFPWVAFFALSHVRAGTELTWNYNYDVGSVPGKVLKCYCGAPNCRGRLL